MIAVLLVLVSHSLDLLTMLLAMRRFGEGEANPIAVSILAAGGISLLVAIKWGGAIGMALVVKVSRRFKKAPAASAWFLMVAAGMGLIGAAANTWALSLR